MADDRFELEQRIGAGGMGVVYRARDRHTGEPVAVKMLTLNDPAAVARFEQEARLLAQLDHPAIVRYVAHGDAADGRRYLAMEWIDGEPLGVRLRGEPLPVAEAIAVAARVADALAAAHARGVLHRDIKPSNILLPIGRPEEARLIDFGIARIVGDDAGLTRTGVTVGTPRYMAPEQIRGRRDLDGRADLFSLGATLFECLTGRPPHRGAQSMAVMAKILLEDAPRLRHLRPELPVVLDDLVAELLSRERRRRPADASVVAAMLRGVADRSTAVIPAMPPPPPSAITENEGKLVCVVLAVTPAIADDRATRGTAILLGEVTQDLPLSERMREIARHHGARVEPLQGGGFAALLTSAGIATDLCARGARYALSVQELMPDARIALAMRRAVLVGTSSLDELLEAVAELAVAPAADGVSTAGIRVDEVASGLLDPRFRVEHGTAGARLVGHVADDQALRLVLGRATPFVGRERELRVLEAVISDWDTEPEPRVVLVTGVAGIGKSRVVSEFLARLPVGAARPPSVWIGRGDPMRHGTPFGLLAPALRGAAGIDRGDGAHARLRAWVAERIDGDAARRVADFLGAMIGLGPDDADGPQIRVARGNPLLLADQLRRAWEELILAETAAGPLVLVLEDLHWGDPPTIKFADAALRAAAGRALLVIAVARPEVAAQFPGLFADRELTQVHLGELGRRAAERLVDAVLGHDVGPTRRARLVEYAAGNPLCMEELIRAAADGREVGVPGTVLAMTLARLDALDTEDRRLLRAGSVFGEAFRERGVARLLGLSPTEPEPLRDRLTRLAEREWLVAGGDGSEYRFRHGLLREAAHATLTDEDRASGHRLAAQWLEADGERDAFVLAGHFERGGDPDGAQRCYRRAAEQALEASDLDDALSRVAAAERCGARDAVLGELRLIEAIAHHWRARHAEGLICARAALALLPTGSAAWYRAADSLAEASLPLGEVDTLIELGETLAAGPARGGDDPERRDAFAIAGATVAMQLALAGRREPAERLMAAVEADVAAGGPPSALVRGRIEFAHATWMLMSGDFGGLIAHCRAAIGAYDEAGDQRTAALLRSNLAWSYMTIGAWSEAEPLLREAAEIADRLDVTFLRGAVAENLMLAHARQGRLDEALAVQEFRLQQGPRGHHRREGSLLIYASMVHRLAGDLERAERAAVDALGFVEQILPTRVYALANLADVHLAQGKVVDALADATAAIALLAQVGTLDEGEALVRLVHAEALLASGDLDGARGAAQSAHTHLLARAARITDAVWRRSFLEEVPENARTVALATRLGG